MRMNYDFYQYFTGEQFAADEFFQQWVLSPDKEKNQFWKTYLHLFPAQQYMVRMASRRVKELSGTGYFKPRLSAEEKRAMKEELFRHLELNALPIPPLSPAMIFPLPARKSFRKAFATAAMGLVSFPVFGLQSEKARTLPGTGNTRNDEIVIE